MGKERSSFWRGVRASGERNTKIRGWEVHACPQGLVSPTSMNLILWNISLKTGFCCRKPEKIIGFIQDTLYNDRCLANPFLLLQSLYSLKTALSIFFWLCSLHACSVSLLKEGNCTVHSSMGTVPSWRCIYHKSSAETGCNADVPLLRAWYCQSGVTFLPNHQFSQRMASTVLQAQKVNDVPLLIKDSSSSLTS